MTTNERAGLTDNAWVKRINELRNDLENQYSASTSGDTYAEVAEWMLDRAECGQASGLGYVGG